MQTIKNIQYFFLFLLTTLIIISCSELATNKKEEKPAVVEAPKEPHKSKKIVEVNYESATVYAGKTNYYFKTASGIRVEIGISNMEENKKAKTPADMLEKGVEGPPGANPEKVGKPYELVYVKGQVVEIREKQ